MNIIHWPLVLYFLDGSDISESNIRYYQDARNLMNSELNNPNSNIMSLYKKLIFRNILEVLLFVIAYEVTRLNFNPENFGPTGN